MIVPSARSRNANLPFSDYAPYAGPAGADPRGGGASVGAEGITHEVYAGLQVHSRDVSANAVAEGIVRIIQVEGPVVAKRVYDVYLRGCGIKRMGNEILSTMNRALLHAIKQERIVSENEVPESGLLFSVVRARGSPPIRLRSRGPRSFEELPPSELKVLARYLAERDGFAFGSEAHLRAVLEFFDLKRLTTQVGTTLQQILKTSFPYEDEFLSGAHKSNFA